MSFYVIGLHFSTMVSEIKSEAGRGETAHWLQNGEVETARSVWTALCKEWSVTPAISTFSNVSFSRGRHYVVTSYVNVMFEEYLNQVTFKWVAYQWLTLFVTARTEHFVSIHLGICLINFGSFEQEKLSVVVFCWFCFLCFFVSLIKKLCRKLWKLL